MGGVAFGHDGCIRYPGCRRGGPQRTGDEVADIRSELAALETRMTWRMAGVMAALLTVQGALTVALLQPAAS